MRIRVPIVLMLAAGAGWTAEERMQSTGEKFLGSVWKPVIASDGLLKDWPHAADPLWGTLFTQITPENCGKWGCVERERGAYTWDALDRMFAFAAEKDLLVKHHGFVWGMQQPKWHDATDDMRAAVDEWIGAFYARYSDRMDRILCVEAVNEPFSQPAKYRDKLGGAGATGWDWVVWVYERSRARAAEAGVHPKHILNEWGILKGGGKAEGYKKLCALLIDRGLIDIVGLQGHFLEETPAETIRRQLDSMAGLGLPLFITEFDLNIPDDELHAARFREIFPLFWEHPAVIGVTFWGHQQGGMWRPGGYLTHKDGTDRPALTWLRDYLRGHGNPAAARIDRMDTSGSKP